MTEALRITRELWHSSDVERVLPSAEVQNFVCDLMSKFQLGRKRILDTALAATLKSAGIRALATFNRSDFELFSFLQVIEPTEEPGT